MEEQDRQEKRPSPRSQIVDADYIPRSEAPNMPRVRTETRAPGVRAGEVLTVLIAMAALTAAAFYARTVLNAGESRAPEELPGQVWESRAGFSLPRPEFSPAPRDGEIPDDAECLGIRVQTVSPAAEEYYNLGKENSLIRGARIYELDEDGAGAVAGLRKGDILVALDWTEILSAEELRRAEGRCSPGDEATLTVYRDGEFIELTVRVP